MLFYTQDQEGNDAKTLTNTNTNTEIASCQAKSMPLASQLAKKSNKKRKEKRVAIPSRIPGNLVRQMAKITIKSHGSIRGESPGNLSLMYELAISQFVDRYNNKQQHATLTASFKPTAKIKGDKLTRF